jgi:hypothetical protein
VILRNADKETCDKAFVRSAWALAKMLYENDQADASGQIKTEAWLRMKSAALEVEGTDIFTQPQNLSSMDEMQQEGYLDNWILFSHR